MIHWISINVNADHRGAAEVHTMCRAPDGRIGAYDVVNYLAAHPRAGDLIEGTGGVRKLRWGRGARGKSGGLRVIYYFYSGAMPLYLLTAFGKGEKANLSRSERNELRQIVDQLVDLWIDRE